MEGITNNMSMLDDINLPHSLRRSLWLIRDEEEGNDYTADEVLDDKPQDIIFNMRSTLTAAYKSGESKYVCPFCGEPIGLKVRTNEGDFFPFFSHYQDSDDSCPLKTTNEIDPTRLVISSENQFKESILHQDMVTKLKEVLELSQTFKDIEIDKVISTPEITGYRRPSLYSIYHDETKVCFDALVSNPQIGLLVGRNAFYKMQKMFYLWVFPNFSTKHQRMSEKDILYMNRRNVFVFDSLEYYKNTSSKHYLGNMDPNHVYAYEESIRQKRLMLNCYWQVPVVNEKGNVSISWKGPELVAFEDILLDKDSFEAYYHDSDLDFYHSYSSEKQLLIDKWMRIKADRWKKIFDSIEKRKIQYEQALARKERRERLAYYYPLIESGEITPIAFQDEKTKLWGYKYNDFDIIPPIYYEVKPFYLGYAWVKKARYWGCIDYKGNRICSFENTNVRKISDGNYELSQKDNTFFIFVQRGNLCLYDDEEELSNKLFKVKKGEYWGVVNHNNDIIIPLEYDYIGVSSNGVIKAKKNAKYGLINETGELLLPINYDNLEEYDHGIVKAQKDGEYGLINVNGKILLPFDYDDLGEYSNCIIVAKKYGKWGIIDEDGKIVIPFEYDYIYHPKHNKTIRAKSNGCWGVINRNNEQIIPFVFDEIAAFINGRAKAKQYKWGIIDESGNTVCPFEYDKIVDDSEAFWRVAKINYTRENRPIRRQNRWGGIYYKDNYWTISHEKWGMVNFDGKIIIPCEYDTIYSPINGIIRCKKNKKWGCLNEKNEIIIPFEFDYINQFIEGKAEAQKNSRTGYINEKGEEIYNIRALSNGLIVYESLFMNKCGLMNDKKVVITGLEFIVIKNFENGLAWAMKDDLWGCIDEKGEETIPYIFGKIEAFIDGKAKVQMYRSGQWGYINEKGEEIYDVFEDLSNGLIKYKSNLKDSWGLMTNSHEIITPPDFQMIEDYSNGLAIAKKDWNWGFINEKGETVIQFEFDELDKFVDGKAKAKKGGQWGCIDNKGNIVIPFEYDEITYSEGEYRLFRNIGYGWNWNQRRKLVKVVNFSGKERKVDITKLESNSIYLAKVSGFHKIGVFIKIPEIGESLIPVKHLKQTGKSIKDYKKGMQIKVQLLSINEEKQQATFKIVEEIQ